MWWFNKSCSQLPGTTYVLWLLKSKLVRYILFIYMAFSILFSITQLVKYTFGNYGIYSSEFLENQPIFRTYGKVY